MRKALATCLVLGIVSAGLLLWGAVSPAPADADGKRLRGQGRDAETGIAAGGQQRVRERERKIDHGNKTTGEIAAWLFGAANLPVALSLLARGSRRIRGLSDAARNRIAAFNRFQKRHLMRFHYLLNPVALAVAGAHFLLSNCDTTALPEWGLVLLLAAGVPGLVLKWRGAAPRLRRAAWSLHTHPAGGLAAFSVILAGHLLMD